MQLKVIRYQSEGVSRYKTTYTAPYRRVHYSTNEMYSYVLTKTYVINTLLYILDPKRNIPHIHTITLT